MKPIPTWKLQKSYTCTITLHKVTETLIGGVSDEFGQTTTSEETVQIKGEIISITLEDMAFLPAGEVKEGDCWGFFLPTYRIDEQDYVIEVNDYITFKGIKFLVTRIEDYFLEGNAMEKRALLRREVGK